MTGVTILTLSEAEAWDSAVARDGLPSQTHGYARGLAAAGLDPRLAVVEAGGARMLLPFIERPWGDHVDIATIPCLSGASLSRDSLAPLQAWSDYARGRGWVTGYIQLALANHGLQALDPDHIRAHNLMIRFDLAHWDIAASVSRNTRKTITRGDRMGAVLVTDKARLLGPFLDLYADAMARFGAAQVFPRAAIETWFQDPAVTVLGAELDGRIEAAHLTRMHGDQAEAHLAALSQTGRPLGAWLVWKATEHYRDRGVRHLNIGGVRQEGDGIHKAKSRFNADEFPLLSVRQVYDRPACDALCAAAGDRPSPDRFPPYRV